MNKPPIRFYRDRLSGHCHRVELLLSMLELPFDPVDVDIRRGDLLTPEFVAPNRFSQVPVIVDDDANGAARVQRWLSASAGPIAHGVARARMVALFGAPGATHLEQARRERPHPRRDDRCQARHHRRAELNRSGRPATG